MKDCIGNFSVYLPDYQNGEFDLVYCCFGIYKEVKEDGSVKYSLDDELGSFRPLFGDKVRDESGEPLEKPLERSEIGWNFDTVIGEKFEEDAEKHMESEIKNLIDELNSGIIPECEILEEMKGYSCVLAPSVRNVMMPSIRIRESH